MIVDSAETRFAHLLQPIRDLTQNWEVDVASQLAEYLDELDQICISFDDGKTTMNFAEAALVIQGSACIYSKKVEYLYSLVYQALDLISNKKRDKQPASVGQDGKDSDATFNNRKDQTEFLTLDDICEKTSPNIEMRNDHAGALEIVALTPEPLIPLEEHEKKKVALCSRTGEMLASCKDFRMNNFTPHASGIIRLTVAMSPSLLLKDLPARQQISDEDSGVAPEDDHDVPLLPLNLSEASDDRGRPSGDVGDGCADLAPAEDCGMEVDQLASPHMQRHQAAGDRRMFRERPVVEHQQEKEKETLDPWQGLDLFVASVDKPLKIGKHFTIPQGVRDVTGKKRKRKGASKIQDFIMWYNNTSSEASHRRPKNGPTFAGLEYLYWSHMKERLKIQKSLYRRMGLPFSPNTLEQKGVQRDDDDAERQIEEQEDHFEALQDHEAGDVGEDNVSDNENFMGEEAVGGLEEQGLPVAASQSDRTSYEELVRRNVELFLVNSQKYAQETALSQRVKNWEDNIRPLLAEQEERLAFDIHSYGNQVVDMFGNVGQKISFASLVKGKDSHEVCRYMLASLQLANDYTVEIEQGEGLGLEEALDTMSLTLLSKSRAHERFKVYAAPSVAAAQI